jgi:alpha-tubulin suppressor-like RCC1 family protein
VKRGAGKAPLGLKEGGQKLKKKILNGLLTLLLIFTVLLSAGFQKAEAGVSPVITAGDLQSLALKSDGTVWAWGRNNVGQLGDGTTINKSTPVQVSNLTDVVTLANGVGIHFFAFKSDGTVWAWGLNSNGQLGDGTRTNRSTPVQLNLSNVVSIARGGSHTLALKSDGTVWSWGFNYYGQLGDGTTTDRLTPVQVSQLTNVVAIAAGFYQSYALKSDGTVWAWGSNNLGQLGDGTTADRHVPVRVQGLNNVNAIVAGISHALALKSDGTVWAWGWNSYGQIGDGTTTNRLVPVQVQNLTDIVDIAAGREHSLALKSDGTVWVWGRNSSGQLGDGTNVSRFSPVQMQNLSGIEDVGAGNNHSIALKSDGTVWAWGENTYGQLGDGTNQNSSVPVQVVGLNLGLSAPVVVSVTVNPSQLALKTTQTQQLIVVATMSDGTTQEVTDMAAYQSDNESVATVSGSGLVSGINQGTANIIVSYQGKTENVPVTVSLGVSNLTVAPSSINLIVGQNQQLAVTATMSDGSVQDVTHFASFTTANTSIASISDEGLITANGPGITDITVSYQDKTATVSVLVSVPVVIVQDLTIQPNPIALAVGDSQPLTVTAYKSDGTTENVTGIATYQVSDPAVVQVSNGTVTALAAGSATITATYEGKTASSVVTVQGSSSSGSGGTSTVTIPERPAFGGTTVISPPQRPGMPSGGQRVISNPTLATPVVRNASYTSVPVSSVARQSEKSTIPVAGTASRNGNYTIIPVSTKTR